MTELIKELKRDIICLSPSYWSLSSGNEELIKEGETIIYCADNLDSYAAGVLSEDIETFLKTPVKELINKINEIVYYQTIEREEEE